MRVFYWALLQVLWSNTHLPSVKWVSKDVQTAHHHCWITSCGIFNVDTRKDCKQKATQTYEQKQPYQREKSCVWQELPAYRTDWKRKEVRTKLKKMLGKSNRVKENKKGLYENTRKHTDQQKHDDSTWWPSPSLYWRHNHNCSGSY